jgi:hypothetical protein
MCGLFNGSECGDVNNNRARIGTVVAQSVGVYSKATNK